MTVDRDPYHSKKQVRTTTPPNEHQTEMRYYHHDQKSIMN